jgi:hypothetical protein
VTEAVTVTWAHASGKAALLCTTASSTLVRIEIGDDFAVAPPVVLLDFAAHESELLDDYAVLPDGTLFAAVRGEDERPPTTIDVVLDFASELEARIGR